MTFKGFGVLLGALAYSWGMQACARCLGRHGRSGGAGRGGLVSTFACFLAAIVRTGRWAGALPKFHISLIFPYFLGF